MNKRSLLNITTIISFGIALAAGPAFAERAPQTMGQDSRVRHVTYSNSDVIRIDTHVRVNTAIEVGRGERITQVLLGDSEAYEVEVLSNRNVISVKPVISGASTNMTVYTNQRTLSFVLTEGRSPETYRVVINYPSDAPAQRTQVSTGVRDSGYQSSGGGSAKPVRVWNNGRHTFFEFGQDVRPSIFTVNGEGFETTTNSVSKGRIVRVNGLRAEYSIRLNNTVVCIKWIEGGGVSDPATAQTLAQKEF